MRRMPRRGASILVILTISAGISTGAAVTASAGDRSGAVRDRPAIHRPIDRPRHRPPRDHDPRSRARRIERRRAVERWERATPRERQRIRRAMRLLERSLPGWSAAERRILLRRLARLPEIERKALRRRLRRIDELDRDGRDELVSELRGMIEPEAEDIRRLERNIDRWDGLSEAERERYRRQLRRFRSLPLEERRKLLDAWAEAEAGDDAEAPAPGVSEESR